MDESLKMRIRATVHINLSPTDVRRTLFIYPGQRVKGMAKGNWEPQILAHARTDAGIAFQLRKDPRGSW